MDFQRLLAKMVELDRPVSEATVEECGTPMMAGMGPDMAPSMHDQQPPPAHPSLSVNLNAQGMDNIEQIMKLITKVNPDMINQKAPLDIEPMGMPSLTPPGPSISSIGDLGNLDAGPLKMLPDLGPEPKGDEPHAEPDADNFGGPSDMDADNDNKPGGENPFASDEEGDDEGGDDDMSAAQGDVDNDGDHDMDDHEAEEEPADDEEDKKDEAWANEPDVSHKSVDYMNNQLAGGMNRPKGTYPKVAGGDNPMQRNESGDLRAQIRAELLQRLAEAKGAN